jgi:hypothetical protein
VQACCVLEGHSLRELHVTGPRWYSNVTVPAWLKLGQLWQLRKLSVHIACSRTYDALVEQAQVVLSALGGCGSTVVLRLPGPVEPFDAALAALREAGLPAPLVEQRAAGSWKV